MESPWVVPAKNKFLWISLLYYSDVVVASVVLFRNMYLERKPVNSHVSICTVLLVHVVTVSQTLRAEKLDHMWKGPSIKQSSVLIKSTTGNIVHLVINKRLISSTCNNFKFI